MTTIEKRLLRFIIVLCLVALDGGIARGGPGADPAGAKGPDEATTCLAPPFAIPVRARRLQGQAPEIRIESRSSGGDTFRRWIGSRKARMTVGGLCTTALTDHHIQELNAGRAIYVATQASMAGRIVPVHVVIPMVDRHGKPVADSHRTVKISIPLAGEPLF